MDCTTIPMLRETFITLSLGLCRRDTSPSTITLTTILASKRSSMSFWEQAATTWSIILEAWWSYASARSMNCPTRKSGASVLGEKVRSSHMTRKVPNLLAFQLRLHTDHSSRVLCPPLTGEIGRAHL